MEVKYFLLSDVNLNVKVKVNSIKGLAAPDVLEQLTSVDSSSKLHSRDWELFVTCSICFNGHVLGQSMSTTSKCFENVRNARWNEWLTFPVKYRDLPPKASFVFTVWDVNGPLEQDPIDPSDGRGPCSLTRPVPLGGTSLPIFNRKGLLKLGHRKLYLWRNREGDPAEETTTPYKAWKAQGMAMLEKAIRKHDQRQLPHIQWLDNLALRRIEKLQAGSGHALRAAAKLVVGQDAAAAGGLESTPSPGIDETKDPTSSMARDVRSLARGGALAQLGAIRTRYEAELSPSNSNKVDVPVDPNPLLLSVQLPPFKHPVVYYQNACRVPPTLKEIAPFHVRDRIFVLHDHESKKDNPMEIKYHKLARASRGIADRELKPSNAERTQIAHVINSPSKHLSALERSLLWRFRYSLIDDKRALTKFLRAVDFSDATETSEALELLKKWSPIDIADALELLSDYFKHLEVRRYAVEQLERADNDDLLLYLLQLVQALRFEPSQVAASGGAAMGATPNADAISGSVGHMPSPLSRFLLQRCVQTLELANFFHWYLMVERDDPQCGNMYQQLHEKFLKQLVQTKEGAAWEAELRAQGVLIEQLVSLGEQSKAKKRYVREKIEKMRELLAPSGGMAELGQLKHPVRMAVRPEIFINGIMGEESTMFKSHLAPMLLCFSTSAAASATAVTGPHGQADTTKYKVIFKSGDDLRQDQLMIQMINLMDALLKKVNLDMKLTPYRVLATSPQDGFVEYVPKSHTLTAILQDYDRDIREFFSRHNQTPKALETCLDNFVKSTAGYCVITYILGIGDRHLDNLLVTTSGHLFHIDFGYIFGRDPKPFPPPMKLCKEMVEAMGGKDSEKYRDFRKYMCSAFSILRKHASLIINLLSLMGSANIPDLSMGLEKNLLKVQEKFRLDLTDEEAEQFLLKLIEESVSALFPQLVERIHKWALYWK